MKKLFLCSILLLFLSTSAFAQAELYGVTIPQGDQMREGVAAVEAPESVLYMIDPLTGTGTEIGPTGFAICSSLDFHPQTGNLYAVCQRMTENGGGPLPDLAPVLLGDVLIMLDVASGQGTEIGPLNIPGANLSTIVTDISFDEIGNLFVHVLQRVSKESNDSANEEPGVEFIEADLIGLIDINTGQFTSIGFTGFEGLVSGIAHKSNGNLYHAGAQDTNILSTINQQTGVAMPIADLTYPPALFDKEIQIASLDNEPGTDTIFSSIAALEKLNDRVVTRQDGFEFYLTTIAPDGTVDIVGPTVPFLTAIAFRGEGRVTVPTLSEWALIALSGVLLAGALVFLRRKRQANTV